MGHSTVDAAARNVASFVVESISKRENDTGLYWIGPPKVILDDNDGARRQAL